jgi:hypothetical protein
MTLNSYKTSRLGKIAIYATRTQALRKRIALRRASRHRPLEE